MVHWLELQPQCGTSSGARLGLKHQWIIGKKKLESFFFAQAFLKLHCWSLVNRIQLSMTSLPSWVFTSFGGWQLLHLRTLFSDLFTQRRGGGGRSAGNWNILLKTPRKIFFFMVLFHFLSITGLSTEHMQLTDRKKYLDINLLIHFLRDFFFLPYSTFTSTFF